jgi:hypothetical protein
VDAMSISPETSWLAWPKNDHRVSVSKTTNNKPRMIGNGKHITYKNDDLGDGL